MFKLSSWKIAIGFKEWPKEFLQFKIKSHSIVKFKFKNKSKAILKRWPQLYRIENSIALTNSIEKVI